MRPTRNGSKLPRSCSPYSVPRTAATRGQLVAEIDELFGDLPQPLIHNGLAKLLEDRCGFETQSDLPPDQVREAAFTAAAKKRRQFSSKSAAVFARQEIIAAVAQDMKTEIATIEASMFADLKSEQRLTQFRESTPQWLLERYNVALAQAILLRSTGVEIVVRGETPARYRQLLRQIKFHRLICDVDAIERGAYRFASTAR